VQQRLNQLVNEAIRDESIRSRMESMGAVIEVMDPSTVEQFIRRERERWTDYIKQAGIEKQ
jgi:tripartite-type tricarboxylate transporter receptor subunit TctC